MRRRGREHLGPVTVRPPRHLTKPAASMTEDALTLALADWSATLRPHEHPPVILERLRAFSVTGMFPLDWADQEREHVERAREHLRALKVIDARHKELMASASPSTRRNTAPVVVWAR